jgi:glycosyltransferase involved in cell wall biosynthesis
VGSQPDGISIYGVELIRGLARVPTDLRFEVVLNRGARGRLADLTPPPNMVLRWVGGAVSPEHGTRGHLLRAAYANLLAARSRDAVVFATSQIEASLAGGPRAVTVHDVTPLVFKEHHPRQYHFYRRLLGPALRASSLVIAPSVATRAALLRHYGLPGEHVRVVPHGPPVPLRHAPPPANGHRPYVLCIARANPVKNVAGVLSAFRAIEGEFGADLVVAGDGAGAAGVPATNASPRVRFLKDVPDAEKLVLLDRATVLVDASLDEGFGFPALEAMARGCPVLAARAGSLPEVCADAALYFDPRDPGDLARTLRRALGDARLRATLAERGLRRAPEFSWASSARAHVDVFEELLDRRGRGTP